MYKSVDRHGLLNQWERNGDQDQETEKRKSESKMARRLKILPWRYVAGQEKPKIEEDGNCLEKATSNSGCNHRPCLQVL